MKRKHPGAVSMAKTRWRKRTKAERSEHARKLAEIRWRGRKVASS